MKKIQILALCLLIFSGISATAQTKVEWRKLDNALKEAKQQIKPVFIDCYTTWCKWCKVLDKETFENDTIAAMLNKLYYPVKFDAEGNDELMINGVAYHPGKGANGRKGTHELMGLLWKGQQGGGYPSMVIRHADFSPLTVEMGYKSAKDLEPVLAFYGKEFYRTMSFEQFSKRYQSEFRPQILKEVFSK